MKDKWKLTIGSSQRKEFVNLYLNDKRFRYWNGKTIGLKIKSSDNAQLLKSAFELKLLEGWRPIEKRIVKVEQKPITLLSQLESELNKILNGNYSFHHKRDCKWVFSELSKFLSVHGLTNTTIGTIKTELLYEFITQSKWSNRTQKNILTTLKCLSDGPLKERLNKLKTRKCKSNLHKPIKNVQELLDDLKEYNQNLYLCCLITYGCLLRPHQEIRLLKWSDIDFNKGFIALSGDRNKSGRNRIVPIPEYVRKELVRLNVGSPVYVFSKKGEAYSKDYFSVLWKRYKEQSAIDLGGITLYSFRHTGAIKVFEKTSSLQKLQRVMGHSDMKVSLTYLRGLELVDLNVNDMPDI